jgi:hypothetical protein
MRGVEAAILWLTAIIRLWNQRHRAYGILLYDYTMRRKPVSPNRNVSPNRKESFAPQTTCMRRLISGHATETQGPGRTQRTTQGPDTPPDPANQERPSESSLKKSGAPQRIRTDPGTGHATGHSESGSSSGGRFGSDSLVDRFFQGGFAGSDPDSLGPVACPDIRRLNLSRQATFLLHSVPPRPLSPVRKPLALSNPA